ncbi:MAG TPA: hypothetical protein VFI02_06580 [Armatimonadota bacterium]|nr:hypothetical protein [Armatimonadota bacterium]
MAQITKSTLKIILIAFLVSWAVNCFIVFFLVLGSGILPIPTDLLFLSVMPVSLIWVLLFLSKRGWWLAVGGLAAAFISFYLIARIFMHFVDTGYGHAKARGASIAQKVSIYHKQHDRWPEDLTGVDLPPLDPKRISPYICEGLFHDHEEKVGGFFVFYELSEGKPVLKVSRRDMSATWNWDTMSWQNQR